MRNSFLRFYHPVVLQELPEYFPTDSKSLACPGMSKGYPLVDSDNRNIQDYWKTKNILYNLNENYFRTSHNFETLKDNEFILAAGCSITMGVGIDEESRWTNQLEKKLNIPIVNLGVGGSDVNTLIRNVSTYIANYNKPKAIIIQIPEMTRFSYLESNGLLECRTYFFVNDIIKDIASKVEKQGADFHFNQEVAILQLITLQTVMSAFRVPVIYFSINALDLKYYDNIDNDSVNHNSYIDVDNAGAVSHLFPNDVIHYFHKQTNKADFAKYEGILMSYGRDHSHPGDLQNTVWAEKLEKILQSKFRNKD